MTDDGTDEPNAEPDGGVSGSDVYASEAEGREYRDSVYEPLDNESLEEAPATNEYPKSDGGQGFRIADLPKVPKISHIVGPSAIMLGASLGSGETMFWPTIVAEGSWGLYWAFWVGVITQFFINTELQRWAIATGESIFQGFNRLSWIWPIFFLVFGFFQLGWPGWAATGSEVFAAWTGVVPRADWYIIGVVSMVVIWLSYQAGPLVYNVIERAQIGLMLLAIAIAVVLLFTLGTFGQFANVPSGAINFGALPSDADFDIATFLGGLAYAGAGGYTNLSQGVWAREKGYGMGAYQGRIKNPLRGSGDMESQDESYTFEPTDKNMKRWRAWWQVTQREHFLTFVVGVIVVATILMSVSTEFAAGGEFGGSGVTMWLDTIIPSVGGLSGWLLYALLFIALFSTQYAQIEVFVRNSGDIVYQKFGRKRGWSMSYIFLGLLTLFTLWGMAIIGFQVAQPWIILVIGAAAAGVMMWPYNALTVILNTTRMPEHTQPGWARILAMWWATGFFGFFSILLIGETLVTRFGLDAFGTTISVVGSAPGGYVLWVFALVVQIYTMYRSGRAKIEASGTVEDADEASGFLA